MSRYLFPRLRDIIFLIIFLGAVLNGPRMLNADSDLGRHLTVGNYILNTLQIPTRNLLSFTLSNQPRPPYEWLAQILFALSYRLLNMDGVVLLTSLVLAVTFVLVFTDSLQRSQAPFIALFLTAWAAAASSLHWLTRPHIFSFLFFAIWLGLLEHWRKGEKIPLWIFFVLMLIWVNTHGGFIFGILAWLAYSAGWLWDYLRKKAIMESGKELLIIGGASLLASIITPSLWQNWNAVLNNRSAYILSQTVETNPPNLLSINIWPFTGLLAITIILFILQFKRVNASHIFLIAGLALTGLLIARNIPFVAIAAAPILTEWMKPITEKFARWRNFEDRFQAIDKNWRGFFWPAAIFVIAAGFFTYQFSQTQTPINQINSSNYPVHAADWLEQHPVQGNMFNDINWGGYLLYRMWPEQHVFIDSQTDFYGEALTRQSLDILNGEKNWDTDLSQYNVTWIIVPIEANLANEAEQSPNWEIAYKDNVAIIFVRK
jgi:hypothetical protein